MNYNVEICKLFFETHYEWIFSSRYVCYCVIIFFYSMLQARFLAYETKREIRLRQSKMELKLSVRNFNDSTCATSNEIAVHDAMVTFDFPMTICRCNDRFAQPSMLFYTC